jgi:hypothetical protein
MIKEDILDDIETAGKYLNSHSDSIVTIKKQNIIDKKKGEGVRPFLELIRDAKYPLSECVIGDRILGKASALLCCHVNVRGVYALQGTKTAIATLLIHGIPSQVDTVITFIKNRSGDGFCPFEQLLENVEDPEQAYEILKSKINI